RGYRRAGPPAHLGPLLPRGRRAPASGERLRAGTGAGEGVDRGDGRDGRGGERAGPGHILHLAPAARRRRIERDATASGWRARERGRLAMPKREDDAAQRPRRTLNIVGTLVALGPFVRDDLPLYHRWINDFAVTRYYLDTPRPQTLEER